MKLSVKLFQDGFHLYELGAAVNIQKDTLCALLSCDLISRPSFQILNFLNNDLVKSKEEFWKSANLFVLFFSHCLFNDNVEVLQDRIHVVLGISCQII